MYFCGFIKYLALICISFASIPGLSQDSINFHRNCDAHGCAASWSIYASGDLTYTGYSSVAGIAYEKNKASFYIGAKLALSKMYLPERGPLGANIGYRYLFLTNHTRWRFFFNIDYQMVFYNAYRGQGESGSKKNYIHELNVSYGVRFKLSEKLYIGQSIGVGKYIESYYNYKSESRSSLTGYDALLRLFISYKLSRP